MRRMDIGRFVLTAIGATGLTLGLGGCDGDGAGEEAPIARVQSALLDQQGQIVIGSNPDHNLWYFRCAGENEACVLGGPKYVAFGANGSFAFKHLAGTSPCTIATFGTDPAQNVVKACYFANYMSIASENTAGPNVHANIAFGAQGVFNFRDINGPFTCNTATFGDPIAGAKACYVPLPGYGWVVAEGGFITATTNDVHQPFAYGANGKFFYGELGVGRISCSKSTFDDDDPAPGVVKACYQFRQPFLAREGDPYDLAPLEFVHVYFGSPGNGNFLTGTQVSAVCSNTTFGGDPGYFSWKDCYGTGSP